MHWHVGSIAVSSFRPGWALFQAFCLSVQASDWPFYRGPEHNGCSAELILSSFPVEGPKQVWKIPLENGFSSFVVSGGLALTQVRRPIAGQDSEVCIALNASTGTEIWATRVEKAFYPDGGAGSDDGPRSTPCVAGSAVFVLSSYLKLSKLNLADGALLWQKDLVALYGGQPPSWQNAASPLLDGDLIFMNCNSTTNSFLALRQTDGALVWRRGAERLTHASPVPATILGMRQIIFFAQSGLVAVAPATGTELWRFAFPFSTSTAASPVVDDDIVYCSAAYGVGAGAVRISMSGAQFAATQLWRNANLMNQWTTAVATNGYLYGLFGTSYSSTAPLKCIELATGAEKWSHAGFGPGGVVLVNGKLLVTDAYGTVTLAETSPDSYNQLAAFQAVTGKCWNSAALSNGKLFARSTTEAACLDLAPNTGPLALLQSLQWTDAKRLRLAISAVDGSAITVDRLAFMRLRSTTDPLAPVSTWQVVSNALLLTNGTVFVELDPPAGQACFTVTDQP